MKKNVDIHDYPKRIQKVLELVKKANISERNRELILQFRDHCSLNGMSLPRTERYLAILKRWAEILQIDFDKATKENLMAAVRIIQENEHYTAWTKSTYKIMLKCFYKWLKGTPDDHPEEVRWIKTTIKRTELRLPSDGDLLTQEEVDLLAKSADNPRDKALVASLYETGARIGELASLQIRNVALDKYGVIVQVTGKTGPRRLRIVRATPYIMTWLQNHPCRDDPEAPLWVNLGTKNRLDVLHYNRIRFILQKLFAKTGIRKRFNPHIFRHARATQLANSLTEFQMNQYFGWIQGSKMPATYVHMSGKNLDDSILALNGLKAHENATQTENPRQCAKCDAINSPNEKFCRKCAGILDIQTLFELEAQTKKEKQIRQFSDTLMNALMQDPEFLEMFMIKAKEHGIHR